MILLNNTKVTPTVFPDNTSQVWKIDPELLSECVNSRAEILWQFENEGEFIQVLQLATLCIEVSANKQKPFLMIPFLPYGRQDKEVTNQTTFALSVFLSTVAKVDLFAQVATIDAHNPIAIEKYNIINLSSNFSINGAIVVCEPDMIVFPDKGATMRGYSTRKLPSIYLDKKRNQITGEIEGLKYDGDENLTDKVLLIVDDLCDGGRTFIEAAKLLYARGAFRVCLYTTHGIYSKGVQVLKEAGIRRVFNHKEEV